MKRPYKDLIIVNDGDIQEGDEISLVYVDGRHSWPYTGDVAVFKRFTSVTRMDLICDEVTHNLNRNSSMYQGRVWRVFNKTTNYRIDQEPMDDEECI